MRNNRETLLQYTIDDILKTLFSLLDQTISK